jgi:U3 small nucleolar RNA-associated protein 14
MSQTVTEREARAVAFDRAASAVSRWQPIVKANREAAHLQFPLNAPPSIGTSSSELAAKFEPRTDLEKKIVDVLDQSGLQGGAAAATYDELPDAGSLEQLQERQAQLSKMRNLLFYQELKWKRQKKIKSKSYHKVLKKEKQKRAALAESSELPEELALMAERARIRERFELRHKNQSRWARRLLSRGSLHNPANRRALEESAKIGQQLRKKMVSLDEDDGIEVFGRPSAEGPDEEVEGDADLHAKLAAEQTPTTGLLAMKFMQRAKPVVEDEDQEAAANEEDDAPPPMVYPFLA